MNYNKPRIAFLAGCLLSLTAQAAVTAEEAKQLGTTLTEFGAEKDGNADGSIPPYTGGRVPRLPADFKSGSGVYPDPFKDEKPLYRVDAKNMAQYDAQLTGGTKALMKRDPNFRLDVYPSHRTMSYPDWLLKNSVKNATKTKLVGQFDGDGIEGGYGGIPFPIPKTGSEVLWNHKLKYQGAFFDVRFTIWLTDSVGKRTLTGDARQRRNFYYYDRTAETMPDVWFTKAFTEFFGPASSKGTNILSWSSLDYSKNDSLNWFYTPGQRRTRLAPENTYDNPSGVSGGVNLSEEELMYTSRLDRFNFKLAGKREVLIPYNNYRMYQGSFDMAWSAKQLNPDVQRWEKHRVWVVEGTLREGARHVYKKRTFYFDEDTWMLVASDAFDQADNLYRVAFAYLALPYDRAGVPTPAMVFYDLTKGNWAIVGWSGDGGYTKISDDINKDYPVTADAMAGVGVR